MSESDEKMKLLRKICAFFRQEKLDADMAEEMRGHLERRVEANVTAGMSPAEARYAAQRQFGGVEQIKEVAREQRGWTWLEHWQQDVRHGWRMMFKTPLLTAVIVVSLGIGIGVNAVIFSWISGVVYRPVPGAQNVAKLLSIEPKTETGSFPGTSWPEYRELAEGVSAFEALAAFRTAALNFGEPGRDERIYSQLVSGNYFAVLGMKPALGRWWTEAETRPEGSAPFAVISEAFWRSRFSGNPDAIGQEIRLNGRLVTIVGVAPPGFLGTVVGLSFDVWLPATIAPMLMGDSRLLEGRENRGFTAMGRLRQGATEAKARGEIAVAMRTMAAAYPATNAAIGAELLPFWRAPRGAARFLLPALAVMQGFMALVLAVVCANAANLLLARATTRRREIGVRLAMGARPWQIVRLFLTESLMLGLLAAGVGVAIAIWGTEALRAVPLPGAFPFKFRTELNGLELGFAALLGGGCATIFGLAPALQAARTDTQLALRSSSEGAGRHRVRSTLVAVEVGLALLALIVAALFVRSLQETRRDETGYPRQGVVLAGYDLNGRGYDRTSGLTVMNELLGRLRSLPGVESAAIASWVPLDFHGMPSRSFTIEGAARSDGGRDRALSYVVTPEYFRVMGIPIIAGTDFSALEEKNGPLQVVVNEEFARRFLGGGSPLGRRVVGGGSYNIVGLVKNTLYETFGEPAKPVMFFSYRDGFMPMGQIHVRTRGSESLLAPELRRIVREINPAIAVYDVRTLGEHVDKNLFFRKIPARMFAVLGPLILMLAAIGIYAVVAYAVAQRTREIGIRLALGASRRQVVNGIVRESMRGILWGTGAASLLAIVVTMHLRGGALSPAVLAGVPALLIAVAAMASWLPARRAAKVDPMVALRAE